MGCGVWRGCKGGVGVWRGCKLGVGGGWGVNGVWVCGGCRWGVCVKGV